MEAVEILQDARTLLADSARWTQGAYARAADGEEEEAWHEDARQWDIEGAVYRAAGADCSQVGQALAAVDAAAGRYALYFNDDPKTQHADVLQVLDAAIRRPAAEWPRRYGAKDSPDA